MLSRWKSFYCHVFPLQDFSSQYTIQTKNLFKIIIILIITTYSITPRHGTFEIVKSFCCLTRFLLRLRLFSPLFSALCPFFNANIAQRTDRDFKHHHEILLKIILDPTRATEESFLKVRPLKATPSLPGHVMKFPTKNPLQHPQYRS